MKKIIYLIMGLILVLSVFADEIQEFNTDLRIEIENNMTTIGIEGREFSYSCGANIDTTKTIKLYKEVECISDALLVHNQMILEVLSDNFNDTVQYYDKYLKCYADRMVLKTKYETNETVDYLERYTECSDDLDLCKNSKSSLVAARQKAESGLSICNTAKKNC